VSPLSYNANAPWSGKAPVTGGAKVKLAGGDADELYTALLVTCYSEGEESMRGTCDSLAATEYSDSRKLLFIIADGIIKGSGNDRTTPDICVDLIEQDPQFADPLPCSYIAVADGSKQHNMAKVYCGHYVHATHRVPAVIVVKCGAPEEADLPKPGNRGKRDSQMILMNFFSRAIYNDRMTPLDYDLFRKIHHLMGVTPDMFEIVLMVDADTKVYPDSLRLLVNCMNNDQLIMGICGETKIANKRDSWVTAIQVFEYYISHHLSKAFESVFGGVTCLPGCFCMYRLKARKGSDWVPILTKPEVCQEYSQNIVETLHEKNLLLLGEDRFLSTLMLRTFPKRKMMFMPQAICKTLVPDSFKVLLSQRRRWINSTVHNLMELVLVKDLCGTFCLSMQFSVMLDLIGTVALPVAIVLTYILIIRAAMSTYDSVTDFVPLAMLLIVLFLPGVLILFTTRKWIYVGWMFIYLIALPVWNMILPVYAYWHFDDFSWGETRKVQGEGKGDGHGASDGVFDSTKVPMRRWEDYERRRLRSIRRKKREADEKRIDNASSVADGSVVTTGDQIGGLSTQDSGTATPTYYYEERPAYDYLESHGAGMNSPHTNQHFDAGNQYPIHPQLTDGTAGSSTAFASQYQNAQYSTPGGGGYYDDGYDSPAYGGQYGYEGGYPQNHYNGSGGLAPPVPAMTRDDYGGEGYYQGQQGQQGHQARPAGPRPPQ
ncbi:Chitin synthase, class 1, partial [Spiromyces aspiralis]